MKKIILLFFLLFFLLGASSVLALEVNYPRFPGTIPPQDFINQVPEEEVLSYYANYFIRVSIWAIGLLAIGALIYAGALYLTSAGKPVRMIAAKEQITAAFFGILLLLCSYLILEAINPELKILKVRPAEKPDISESTIVEEPDIEPLRSSIHTEMPFGRLIEGRIFETAISDPEAPEGKIPRLTRITVNANTTLSLAAELSQNSGELSSLAQGCDCRQAEAVCGWPPICAPIGVPGLSEVLGTTGLDSYIGITGVISGIVGGNHLGTVLGLSEAISQGTSNLGQMTGVLSSVEDIAGTLSSSNVSRGFSLAEDISTLTTEPGRLAESINNLSQITETPSDLSLAFSEVMEVASLAEESEDLSQILESLDAGTDVLNIGNSIALATESQTAYSSVVDSMENITGILEDNSEMASVFSAAGNIASIAESDIPQVITSSKNIAGIMDNLGTPQEIDEVFALGEDIASIVSDPKNYSSVVVSSADIAESLIGSSDFSQFFEVAEEIASTAENPSNLSIIISSTKDIAEVTAAPAYLSTALKAAGDIRRVSLSSPREVLSSAGKIARRVRTPEEIIGVLGQAERISSVVENSAEYPEVIISLEDLSSIFENSSALEETLEIAEEKGLEADNISDFLSSLENDPDFRDLVPPGEMAVVLNRMERIAERIGDLDKITVVVETTKEIRNSVSSLEDLVAVFNGIKNISEELDSIDDLELISHILEDIPTISQTTEEAATIFDNLSDIVETVEDFGRLEDLMVEVTVLTDGSSGLSKALGGLQDIVSIAQNPGDLDRLQRALAGISDKVPDLDKISGVLNDFSAIVLLIEDPSELTNIKVSLEGLSQVFPEAGELFRFLKEYAEIASLTEDLGNIQGAADKLSEIIPLTGDLEQLFSDIGDIADFAENPGDFGILLENLSSIIPEAENLASFLEEFEDIAELVDNPEDLAGIGEALGGFSEIIPETQEFSRFLGEYSEVASVVSDPREISRIMDSASAVAEIAPAEISPLIGELTELGSLFGGPEVFSQSIGAGSCSCDTCGAQRPKIERIQAENIGLISALRSEQEKTIKEREELEEELDRLRRSSSFIGGCHSTLLHSLEKFFTVKNNYEEGGGIVREIRFWDDTSLSYFSRGDLLSDWASFMCIVGGNILSTDSPPESLGVHTQTGLDVCQEIPVGEIIDRTLRTGNLLSAKLKRLIDLDREIIAEVDELQQLVSECTSQSPPCHSICIPVYSHGSLVNCIKWCEGSTCPYRQIKRQADRIRKVLERRRGIRYTINNPLSGNIAKREETGLLPVINGVVPQILADLRGNIRQPLLYCQVEEENVLVSCENSVGKVGQERGLVKGCAKNDDFFKPCLDQCYLKSGNSYPLCLSNCLEAQRDFYSSRRDAEELPGYRHELNFFCCPIR